jgi:hypothetical protein
MATLSVKITGGEAIMEKVKKLGAELYNLELEMTEIGKMQTEFYANDAIVSRGSVYGKSWTPLSPGYDAWKRQNYPGRPMMVGGSADGEHLIDKFAWKTTPMSVKIDNTKKVNGYSLLAIQQNGSKRGIPPRTIMQLEESQIIKIKEIVRLGVRRKIEEA